MSVFWTIYSNNNGGRHNYYLTPDQQVVATKMNWWGQPLPIMAIATGKMSVALFELRILGPNKYRAWFLWWLIFSCPAVLGIAVIVTYAQCTPAAALWTPALQATAKCWPPARQANYAVFAGSYAAFADFALSLIPTSVVYNLQMKRGRKIALCCIMGLGIL